MSVKEEYKNNFGAYKIPETLQKLMAFEAEYGEESFSECFYLGSEVYKEPDMGQYSLDVDYFERLIEFATADGTGGTYCFWISEVNTELENAPIVFMGSEGHIQIIAKNIKELLQLLSFGPEIMDGEFYKELEDFEEPENTEEYRIWLKEELGITPIKNLEGNKEVNTIIKKAIEEYEKPFKKWIKSLTPQY